MDGVAEELQSSGPPAPFAATPLTSLPAAPGEGVDKARHLLLPSAVKQCCLL